MKNKFFITKNLAILTILILSILRPVVVSAITVEEQEKKIQELEKKLENTKKKSDSLAKEVEVIESNITIKEVQIQRSAQLIEDKITELAKLQEEIGLLEVRLNRIGDNIDAQRNILDLRIRKQYIQSQNTMLEKILSSKSIGDFITKIKYIQLAQKEDQSLLNKMEIVRGNYEDQQDLLNQKRLEVEKVKLEIEAQKKESENLKNALEDQKSSKDDLLRVTKNNEKTYKALLDEARKELEQITQAANIVIRDGKGIKVKRGEVIGSMGSTGFSTGVHLHFGVYEYSEDDFKVKSSWGWYYSNYKNPLSYLKGQKVNWQTGCKKDPQGENTSGKGDWLWPVDSPKITQNFGSNTCYNWQYGGKPHPALDIGPPVRGASVPVKAVDDGVAYFCRNCLRDGGNGVFVFHSNDKMSVYWHLR